MLVDFIRTFLPPGNVPNKFTIGMGSLIRNARQEAGLTQEQLASNAYIPQSTLSKMENGKVEASSSELIYLSNALDKPINYFFPKQLLRQLNWENNQDPAINELLLLGGQLKEDDLQKVIAQIRALIDFDA